MLMTACGATGAVQGDDGYCALYKPVLLTDGEIAVLTGETKRVILRNNQIYRDLGCDR